VLCRLFVCLCLMCLFSDKLHVRLLYDRICRPMKWCVCVCVCVCMYILCRYYVRMYLYIYMYVCTCVCMNVYVCMYVRMYFFNVGLSEVFNTCMKYIMYPSNTTKFYYFFIFLLFRATCFDSSSVISRPF